MNRKRFFSQLSLLTAIVAVVNLVFCALVQPALLGFSLITTALFVVLSLSMYFFSAKAAVSKDKNAFTRLMMVFTFAKIALLVVFVLGYKQLFKPAGNVFMIPFVFIYFAFTIFETMFLTKLGKIKAH